MDQARKSSVRKGFPLKSRGAALTLLPLLISGCRQFEEATRSDSEAIALLKGIALVLMVLVAVPLLAASLFHPG